MSEQSEKLCLRAVAARRENRLDDAKRDLFEAVAACRAERDEVDLANALVGLAQIESDLQHAAEALKNYEEAVAIYRAKNDSQRLAHTIRHVGDIHRRQKRADLAEPCYREALELYRRDETTAQLDLANALRGFALLQEDKGEPLQAKVLWDEARGLYAAVHVREGVAESSRRLALLAGQPQAQSP
jgi:tetratricopeptide (TPR) repeat protein